ncbi:unnamed protein product [Caenorhabditis nigoni]
MKLRPRTQPPRVSRAKPMKKKAIFIKPTIVAGETLPLFSRLKEFGKNLVYNFPGTAFFTSILVNVLGDYLSKAVIEAIKLGNQNPMCCSCGPGITCMKNSDCECAIASKQFQEKLKIPPVLRKKAVKLDENQYWRIQFCCGPKCQCSSECSLKGLDEIDKDHDKKFEVYRTPVMSFNGEIVGKRALKRGSDAEQYSLRLIDQDQALIDFLKTAKFLAKNLVRPFATAFDRVVFINPLKYGNVGRFLSHSCRPNLEMMRIFQGGVSPGHMRIVFIANRNIKAGENLCFDYGESYVENHIEHCMCPEHCMKKNKKESKVNTVRTQRAVRNQTQETSMMGRLRSFFR